MHVKQGYTIDLPKSLVFYPQLASNVIGFSPEAEKEKEVEIIDLLSSLLPWCNFLSQCVFKRNNVDFVL